MTIREQVRRIIKAAPHLPIQTMTGISILFFGIPILLNQFFESVTAHWTETKGIAADHKVIQDRIRDGEVEYFYSIGYEFNANGKKDIIFLDKGYRDKSLAESELNSELSNPTTITIWYDNSDPINVTFERTDISGSVFLGLLIILILPLLYFRWLMLKYYELEIEEST
jgi:hypothetical protein